MRRTLISTLVILTSVLAGRSEDVSVPTPLNQATLLLSKDAGGNNPYTFSDPIAAIEAINRAAETNGSVTLYVAPSVYWLDDPDDPAVRVNQWSNRSVPYAVEIKCDTLNIIGLAERPEDVVWAVNRGQTQGALGNYTMIHFHGKSLRTENITFGNYCNVDLVYPRDPSMNRPKRRDAIVQAQIGWLDGTDRLFARNCRFISRLNLLPLTGARRSLYKDCYFECTDDALTGSAVYQDCRFTFHSGKPFYSTASTGAIFLNCDIHSLTDGTQYLTKAPGMVTLIDTRFTSDNPLTLKWTRDASAVRCYQSNVSLNGRPVTVDADRPELSAYITDSPVLDAYKFTLDGETVYNTANLLAGDDGWDPLNVMPLVTKAERQSGKKLTGIPVALRLDASSKKVAAKDEEVKFVPVTRLWGDYDAEQTEGPVAYKWASGSTMTLTPQGGTAKGVSANSFPKEVANMVSVAASSGLTGATEVKVAPYLLEAPTFTSAPVIERNKTDLNVNYALSAGGNDDSYIVWYRSTRPDRSDSIAVRHGRGLAGRTYPLSAADKGCYVSASVRPRHDNSHEAAETSTAHFDGQVSTMMIGILNTKERELNTSFAEIPIRSNGAGKAGVWHFDTYKPEDTSLHDWQPEQGTGWYYGTADDAATGTGLVQKVKGARLSYTPARKDSRDMSLSLVAEPCKGPGQGFGSATGQYMDICLKYDPVSLTGYGLRIERTPDYDKAVTFTLVSYNNGKVTPISEAVPTSCYRNPCTINVEVAGGMLRATASTGAKAVNPSDSRIRPSVSLSAPVEMTGLSSFAIQHTGSTGASATLIRDLSVKWK